VTRQLGTLSARHGPWIDYRQTGSFERTRVARCHGEPLRGGDRGDVAIGRGEAFSGRARLDGEFGIVPRRGGIEGQDAGREQL